MSYGPNAADLFRRAAGFVDKILKGARPGDLPVEQPTKFELVINLKTVKTGAVAVTINFGARRRGDSVNGRMTAAGSGPPSSAVSTSERGAGGRSAGRYAVWRTSKYRGQSEDWRRWRQAQ